MLAEEPLLNFATDIAGAEEAHEATGEALRRESCREDAKEHGDDMGNGLIESCRLKSATPCEGDSAGYVFESKTPSACEPVRKY